MNITGIKGNFGNQFLQSSFQRVQSHFSQQVQPLKNQSGSEESKESAIEKSHEAHQQHTTTKPTSINLYA